MYNKQNAIFPETIATTEKPARKNRVAWVLIAVAVLFMTTSFIRFVVLVSYAGIDYGAFLQQEASFALGMFATEFAVIIAYWVFARWSQDDDALLFSRNVFLAVFVSCGLLLPVAMLCSCCLFTGGLLYAAANIEGAFAILLLCEIVPFAICCGLLVRIVVLCEGQR